MTEEKFRAQFRFDPKLAGKVAVECEGFTKNHAGRIVPAAGLIISDLEAVLPEADLGYFSTELSACQLEWRTGPVTLGDLPDAIVARQQVLAAVAARKYCSVTYVGTAPEMMPLDVTPLSRYGDIAQRLTLQQLDAACRCAGTHIHVGLPDHEAALQVYNHALRYHSELMNRGDRSSGARMNLYRLVAGDQWQPPVFRSWTELHQYAQTHGWEHDPGSCWFTVRISRHGTLEFRMFDSTSDVHLIRSWAARCLSICAEAMAYA